MFRNQHNPVDGNDFAAGIHWYVKKQHNPSSNSRCPVGQGMTEAALSMSDGLMLYGAGRKNADTSDNESPPIWSTIRTHIIPGITLTTQMAWETQIGSGMVRERRWDGRDEGISQEDWGPISNVIYDMVDLLSCRDQLILSSPMVMGACDVGKL
ncbi:hypothetical protein FB45DRAFT_874427 [Roridomyces roridus]|uniref:Uncharacterized protein n=1 Tax=Roridomyces roridus TaxID=1738132 RepID=A0AAD7B8T0_9AGAR|nr:hypothetical protein FB45DRAFT_874427 [Roridomyces roridus]